MLPRDLDRPLLSIREQEVLTLGCGGILEQADREQVGVKRTDRAESYRPYFPPIWVFPRALKL